MRRVFALLVFLLAFPAFGNFGGVGVGLGGCAFGGGGGGGVSAGSGPTAPGAVTGNSLTLSGGTTPQPGDASYDAGHVMMNGLVVQDGGFSGLSGGMLCCAGTKSFFVGPNNGTPGARNGGAMRARADVDFIITEHYLTSAWACDVWELHQGEDHWLIDEETGEWVFHEGVDTWTWDCAQGAAPMTHQDGIDLCHSIEAEGDFSCMTQWGGPIPALPGVMLPLAGAAMLVAAGFTIHAKEKGGATCRL